MVGRGALAGDFDCGRSKIAPDFSPDRFPHFRPCSLNQIRDREIPSSRVLGYHPFFPKSLDDLVEGSVIKTRCHKYITSRDLHRVTAKGHTDPGKRQHDKTLAWFQFSQLFFKRHLNLKQEKRKKGYLLITLSQITFMSRFLHYDNMTTTMNKIAIKSSLILFSLLAVGYPLWVHFENISWALDSNLLAKLFPAFGLTAFSLLWLHVVGGVFEPWLRKYIDFDKFVHATSFIILVCIIFHPLLLLIEMGFSFSKIFLSYGAKYIWFAIVGWLLLVTYDIGKFLNRYDFFVRNWNKILIVSTVGFLLTFLHSLNLGGDLQSGPLRIIWIFYGVTAIIATIYLYGVKRS
ncbi:MAG: hypothetical protein WAX80_03305 [Minisyncoccia bacterium]